MFERIRRRLTYANVVSTIAVFGALGGGGAFAVGAIPDKQGEISACYVAKGKRAGQARLLVEGSKCRKGEKKLSWNQQGVPGRSGALGRPGADLTDNCQGNDASDVMVKAGSVCIDRYEASIWTAATGGTQITDTLPCDVNGQDCKGKIFARSVAGVAPRASITWFQAQQALAHSGKRLPTNAEWQVAVAGTPDSTACNVSTGAVASTGASVACVSAWGTSDMVGNLWEWVADWDEEADSCTNWPPGFGSGFTCFGDATPSRFPGACIRGRGQHRAVERYRRFARSRQGAGYVLKCDIAGYFRSVDHEVLLRLLERRIGDCRLLALLRSLIARGAEGPGVGMPIGSLTSQMFANLYLDPLDHFVKEGQRVRHYVRYMDDFILLLYDRMEARRRLAEIEAFLAERLRLRLNPRRRVSRRCPRPATSSATSTTPMGAPASADGACGACVGASRRSSWSSRKGRPIGFTRAARSRAGSASPATPTPSASRNRYSQSAT